MNLVVLIGAGASFDCHHVAYSTAPNIAWKPPLVNNVFGPRETFEVILDHYPAAQAAASYYHSVLSERRLESFILKSLQEKMEHDIWRRQYLQIPLYLHAVFSEISSQYLPNGGRAGNAYQAMIGEILHRGFENVVFLTLNYDLLLDFALEQLFSMHFKDLRSYLNIYKNWHYIKYHGSCDWVKNIKSNGHHTIDLFSKAKNVELLRDCLDSNISVLRRRAENGRILSLHKLHQFPAIAVPIEGNYKAVCPETHLAKLDELLAMGPFTLLSIGFSGTDADVLQRLEKHKNSIHKIVVVDEGEGNASDVGMRLDARLGEGRTNKFSTGFSFFVHHELRKLLDNLP